MPTTNTLYDEIVSITADYLGPAAQRFIDRQIDSHLNKSPQELTKKDLEKLVAWSRVSMALLTNDRNLIDGYVNNLLHLARNK